MSTVRDIIVWPNTLLKKKSDPVDFERDAYFELVNDMLATMLHHQGLGLAAIQIGVALRVIVLNVDNHLEAWINPKITKRSADKELMPEGCLSLPGVIENVSRSVWVDVQGFDELGDAKTTVAMGIRAQAFQHEIDHLDGKLYVDKKDPGFKDRLRKKLRGKL